MNCKATEVKGKKATTTRAITLQPTHPQWTINKILAGHVFLLAVSEFKNATQMGLEPTIPSSGG